VKGTELAGWVPPDVGEVAEFLQFLGIGVDAGGITGIQSGLRSEKSVDARALPQGITVA
jgi:hypothetical protein